MSFLLRRAMMAGGVIAGSAYDPYFEQVVSLAFFDGIDGATTFTDQATSTVGGGLFTAVGAGSISTARSKNGVGSVRFTANTGGFSSANNVVFASGPDFTAEAWVYVDAIGGNQVLWRHGDYATNGYEFYVNAAGQLACHGGNAQIAITAVSTLPAATWTHCAVTRAAGVWKIWVNGVLGATSGVNNLVLAGPLYFGFASLSISPIGNIDTWRYTANVARYTANFTPPAAAFPNASSAARTYTRWDTSPIGPSTVLSNGNLTVTNTGSSFNNVRSMIPKASGKWYWEVTIQTAGSVRQVVGIATVAWDPVTSTFCGGSAGSWGYYGQDGTKWGLRVNLAYGATFGTGDVIGVALDASAGELSFYKNGVSQGVAYTGLTGPFYAAMGDYTNPDVTTTNFGATAFVYTPPAGYNAGLYTTTQYATWNPSDKNANITLSNGNRTAANSVANIGVRATLGKSAGKWYWEVTRGTTGETLIGVGTSSATLGNYLGFDASGVGYDSTLGSLWKNNAAVTTGLATYAVVDDTVGIALNQDAGTVAFYKNGVLQTTYTHGLSGAVFPMEGAAASTQSDTTNFGATPFKYTIPAGYNPGLF